MRYSILPLLLFLTPLLSSCSAPLGKRLSNATSNAISHPLTWGSAGAALLFALDGNRYDDKLSSWASRNTPVFGSQDAALEASDTMRRTAYSGAILATLLVPSEKESGEWFVEKGEELVFQWASSELTQKTTGILKRNSGRERPNDADSDDSFPSAHSSSTFNSAVMGSRSVERMAIPEWAQTTLTSGFYTLAGGTAWARIEAGVHYPSDVLAGAAIGNFFAILIYDSFIRDATANGQAAAPPFRFEPMAGGGASVQISILLD